MSDIYVKRDFNAGLETPITATANNDIPNLGQVNSLIEGYSSVLDAVRVESETNVDTATGGLLTIDGVTLVANDRVLLIGQTDPIDNGVYVAASGAWSRADDIDTGDEIKPYTTVYVMEGTEHAHHQMALQATADVTVGTDAQTWVHSYTFENDADQIDVVDSSFSVLVGTDVQTVLDDVDDELARVNTLTGSDGSDLGAFTGAVITDNGTVKAGMQELSDAIENIDVSSQALTVYDGQKYEASGQTIAANTWTTFTHSLNETYPSGIEIYNMDGLCLTHAFNIDLIDANSLRVQNETATIFTDMIVVVRA